jgi:hypothetical protein
MAERTETIKCPWCAKEISIYEVKAKRYKNEYGTVLERRCKKCNKVLAAYLDEEGNFLPAIRRF